MGGGPHPLTGQFSAKRLCDGCNVREPFEHRCHGLPCPCQECREADRLFGTQPPVTADHTPERPSAQEGSIRDLTYTIMRFYGYTDDDIAEAEAVHPGRVCDDDCFGEDGKSVHPGAYDELGGAGSTVVEAIWPWVAAHLADVEARLAAAWDEGHGTSNGGCVYWPDCAEIGDHVNPYRAALHPDPSEGT